MATGHVDPFKRGVMTTVALIRAAFPRDAAKTIARSLNLTPRQGRRVAAGEVPHRIRPLLIDLLEAALAANERRIREYRRQLRERDADLAHTAAVASSRTDRTRPQKADRPAQRTNAPSVSE